MEQLDFIQFGSWVRRYHGVPVINEQTNAAHLFGVAHLVAMMALDADPEGGVGLTVPLLMAALVSDLPEWISGDMPAPGKRNFPEVTINDCGRNRSVSFRELWNELDQRRLEEVGLDWEHKLEPRQRKWLKLADAMEGCLFCIKERMMGNRYIEGRCYVNFRKYIDDVLNGDEPEPMVAKLIVYIDDMWEQANGG